MTAGTNLNMKKFIFSISMAVLTAASSQAQTIWSYDFNGTGSLTTGSSTNTFVVPPTGGGTNIFRIGTAGGNFTLGASSFGTGNSLIGIAPTSASVNKFTTFNWNNPTTAFSLKFDMRLTGGSSGIWSIFTGNGASFDSGTASFTGAQVFSGLRLAYGAAGTISASNRVGNNWAAISGAGFSQSNNFSVAIYGNNGSSSITYDGNTLASGVYDLWVNNTLVAQGLSKAETATANLIDSFMIYGENSTGNVATFEIDNLQYANYAIPEPSSSMLMVLGAGALIGVRAMKRRKD